MNIQLSSQPSPGNPNNYPILDGLASSRLVATVQNGKAVSCLDKLIR